MTEQAPEQTAPAAAPTAYQTTTPAPADVTSQASLQESTAAPSDGSAAPAVADSPSLEPATADGPTVDHSVSAGDLVTWVETDADGYEHTRNGLVTEVLELPGDDDGEPVLHARIAELPESRLLSAERLQQL